MNLVFPSSSIRKSAVWCLAVSALLAVVTVSACSPTTPAPRTSAPGKTAASTSRPVGASGSGSISATINGAKWISIETTASYRNVGLTIAGADGSGPPVAVGVGVIASKPGTYQISAQNPVGNATITTGSSVWQAGMLVGSGTVTITSLTSTRASGTFSFTMVALTNTSATGTKVITNGVFDVTFGSPVTLPTQASAAPSAVTAQVDGKVWSSISVQVKRENQALTIIAIGADSTSIILGLSGIALAGTYSISYQNPAGSSAIYSSVSGGWNTFLPGGTGTVVIRSLTSNHATGTFSFDGAASAGTSVIHVTDGKFDVSF